MCMPVGGPPGTAGLPPDKGSITPAGGPGAGAPQSTTPATAGTSVAGTAGGGATGQAATGIAALGSAPGGIAEVLKSLVAALQSVVAALGGTPASAPVAGGGAGPSQGASGIDAVARQLEDDINRIRPDDPRRQLMAALRPKVEQIRADAQRTGSVNPVDLMDLRLEHMIAFKAPVQAPSSPVPASQLALSQSHQVAYQGLRPMIAQMRADANRTGSFDPLALMQVELRMALVSATHLNPNIPQMQGLLQRIEQQRAQTGTGVHDPTTIQQLHGQVSALVNGGTGSHWA